VNSSSSITESKSVPGKFIHSIMNIKIFYLYFSLECTNDVYKAVLERNCDLERENDRMQRLNTTLQSRIHEITLRVKDLQAKNMSLTFRPFYLVFRFK
jgi:uncharacterized protein YlxW (UPF0749 family)